MCVGLLDGCVCVCVCVCVFKCVRVCLCVCVSVCLCEHGLFSRLNHWCVGFFVFIQSAAEAMRCAHIAEMDTAQRHVRDAQRSAAEQRKTIEEEMEGLRLSVKEVR